MTLQLVATPDCAVICLKEHSFKTKYFVHLAMKRLGVILFLLRNKNKVFFSVTLVVFDLIANMTLMTA